MYEPQTIQELDDKITEALALLPAGQMQADALFAKRTLVDRAHRVDEVCDVCHAAAVAEGERRAQAQHEV